MDAFLFLMQVGSPGDWVDRGLPEVSSGHDAVRDAHEAGVRWLSDHDPNIAEDGWRLLVWANVRDQPYDRNTPDATVSPRDFRAALDGAGPDRSRFRATRKRLLRASRVVHKLRVTEGLLGRAVLVTRNVQNTTAPMCEGPWFPAEQVGPDVVATRVRGFGERERGGRVEVQLSTMVGDVGWMPEGHAVIPADED